MFTSITVSSSAQIVSTSEPAGWKNSMTMADSWGLGKRVALSNNTPEEIQKELLDEELITLIGRAHEFSTEDFASIKVVAELDRKAITLYQVGTSGKAFKIMKDQLGNYFKARNDGHSRDFMLACFTNVTSKNKISDPDVKALVDKHHDVSVSWLTKTGSGTTTNKTGEVSRWVEYTLIDGEIAWRYYLSLKPDGSLAYVFDSRCDAKEVDPKYKQQLKEVEESVTAEMKKEGSFGILGSCHRFWELKREKLQKKGVSWRSPSELNPNTTYD